MRLHGFVVGVLAVLGLAMPAAASADGGCANEAVREAQHSTRLPDCRAYELVSPPDKQGGSVASVPSRTRAAQDGSAVSFMSLNGFGDIAGTGIAAEYMGVRDGAPGTDGWSVHGLVPKVEPLSFVDAVQDLDTQYQGEFSNDLSAGLLVTSSDLVGDPEVAGVPNVYLRRDLRSAGEGSYELLSPCLLCTPASPLTLSFGAPNPGPFVADATPDLGSVLFESRNDLVAPAVGGQPKLYDWDHGRLYLEGILPEAEGGGAAEGSVAGGNATDRNETPHTISGDGSKVFFIVPSTSGSPAGQLYMRVDHRFSVHINASERSECLREPSACPETSAQAPVRYETASVDGSKVFFESPEQLTDTPGSGIYMYDTSKPDSDPHNLTLLSVDSEPAENAATEWEVMGASDDGSYVYFIANAQLIAGEPRLENRDGIYVWHEGSLRYIGAFLSGQEGRLNQIAGSWSLTPVWSRLTPDGRHLLFTAENGALLSGFNQGSGCHTGEGGCNDLYLYDASKASLTCVSCNPSGAPATTNSNFVAEEGFGGARRSAYLNHPLSDDGRFVFFTSGERLVPEDHNGSVLDVYEYDSVTGKLHLITSGTSSSNSYFVDATPDGSDVFFTTAQPLLGWDTDASVDLYDARVGGGFPEPAVAAECAQDACQGAAGAPAGALAPGSALVEGSGDASAVTARKVAARRATKAQRLAQALKACGRQPKRQRKRCQAAARKRYGAKGVQKTSGRGK